MILTKPLRRLPAFLFDGKILYWVILLTYIAVGTMLGFIQGGVAPILRTQGVSLESMFWVFSLYLPYGLSFLWAPTLDSMQKTLSYRSQILIGQCLTVGLLLLIVILSWFEVSLVYYWLFILLANIIIASMDLVLDGLSSLNATPDNQSMLAAIKVAGIACGSLIGGGGLVASFDSIGIMGVFGVMAVLFLILIPFTLCIPKASDTLTNPSAKLLGFRVIWSDKVFRSALWRTTFLTCIIMALFNFNRILLVDLEFSLHEIGLFLGILTPIGALVLSLILPILIKKQRHTVFNTMSICLLLLLVLLILLVKSEVINIMLWVVIGIGVLCNGFLIVIGGSILSWAKSNQSATNYSLLYVLGRLAGIVCLMVLPVVIEDTGWITFYLALSGCFVLACFYFSKVLNPPNCAP